MANTDISALTVESRTIASTQTENTVTLDPNKIYTFHHTGIDASGVAAANNIILGLGAAPAAYDNTAETNKVILLTTTAAAVGPGVTTVYFKTMTGGSPIMNIIVGPSDFGIH